MPEDNLTPREQRAMRQAEEEGTPGARRVAAATQLDRDIEETRIRQQDVDLGATGREPRLREGAQRRVAAERVDPEFDDVDVEPDQLRQEDGVWRPTDDVRQRQAAADIDAEFDRVDVGPEDVRRTEDGYRPVSDVRRQQAAAELSDELPIDVAADDVRLNNGDVELRSDAEDRLRDERTTTRTVTRTRRVPVDEEIQRARDRPDRVHRDHDRAAIRDELDGDDDSPTREVREEVYQEEIVERPDEVETPDVQTDRVIDASAREEEVEVAETVEERAIQAEAAQEFDQEFEADISVRDVRVDDEGAARLSPRAVDRIAQQRGVEVGSTLLAGQEFISGAEFDEEEEEFDVALTEVGEERVAQIQAARELRTDLVTEQGLPADVVSDIVDADAIEVRDDGTRLSDQALQELTARQVQDELHQEIAADDIEIEDGTADVAVDVRREEVASEMGIATEQVAVDETGEIDIEATQREIAADELSDAVPGDVDPDQVVLTDDGFQIAPSERDEVARIRGPEDGEIVTLDGDGVDAGLDGEFRETVTTDPRAADEEHPDVAPIEQRLADLPGTGRLSVLTDRAPLYPVAEEIGSAIQDYSARGREEVEDRIVEPVAGMAGTTADVAVSPTDIDTVTDPTTPRTGAGERVESAVGTIGRGATTLTIGAADTPTVAERSREAVETTTEDVVEPAADVAGRTIDVPALAARARAGEIEDVDFDEVQTPTGRFTRDLIEGVGTGAAYATAGVPAGVVATGAATRDAAEFTAEEVDERGVLFGLSGAAIEGYETTLQVGEVAGREFADDPVRGAGIAVGGVGTALGTGYLAGRGLGLAGRGGRDRVRTVGGERIDRDELTPAGVAERVERGEAAFPAAQDPGLYQRAPDVAVRQQARDTPDAIETQFETAGLGEGATLWKALDVEPDTPRRGRAGGFETVEGGYEAGGAFVGPDLSPHFLRTQPRDPAFSWRPGLPDLGPSPTAVAIRTDVRRPDADTMPAFRQEMVDRTGETTARTLPRDEVNPGEIEAVIPPGAQFADVGTGPGRDMLRRAGIGADYYTEIGGRRVPIRTVAPQDELGPGTTGLTSLLRDERGMVGARPEGTRVMRDIDDITTTGRPVDRFTPLTPATDRESDVDTVEERSDIGEQIDRVAGISEGEIPDPTSGVMDTAERDRSLDLSYGGFAPPSERTPPTPGERITPTPGGSDLTITGDETTTPFGETVETTVPGPGITTPTGETTTTTTRTRQLETEATEIEMWEELDLGAAAWESPVAQAGEIAELEGLEGWEENNAGWI